MLAGPKKRRGGMFNSTLLFNGLLNLEEDSQQIKAKQLESKRIFKI